MSKTYKRRRKKSPIVILIVILIAVLSVLVGEKLVYLFSDAVKSENKAQIKKELSLDKNKENSENVENNLPKKDEIKKVEIQPTEYKKGTSHNHEATAWAYKCQDVSKWINTPSEYKGQDKLVFLTFDDGPSPIYTEKALDILKKYQVHATFFVLGSAADRDYAKDILQREMKEGHAVGLHSYSHEYSYLYPKRIANVDNIMGEIEQNRLAIAKSLGEDFSTTIFRYPGGHMSWKNLQPADEALAQKGIYNIDWNVLTGDAEVKGSKRDIQGALENIKEDMAMYQNPKVVVVLMHDIKAKSIEELPQIIEYFSSMGYKFGILT